MAYDFHISTKKTTCLKSVNLKPTRRMHMPAGLRHTYICMRLIEGADIYALAKNCRTSVEMIERLHAVHIRDLLDTSTINVMRPKRSRKPPGPNDQHAG